MLSESQFGPLSGRRINPDDVVVPDAESNRHSPGSYQPTLPGMEHMAPWEHTHTGVVFKKPKADDDTIWDSEDTYLDPKRNSPATKNVQIDHLTPTQDWVTDSYLHSPHTSRSATESRLQAKRRGRESLAKNNDMPSVQRFKGQLLVHDGHHRIARAAIQGKKSIDVNYYE